MAEQAPSPPDASVPLRRASPERTAALGLGLLTFALLWAYGLLSFWPPSPGAGDTRVDLTQVTWLWSTSSFTVPPDVRVLLVVLAAGGLGSFVHTATSFADFVGNERLTASWTWWYAMKPFIGMALALVFYVAFRGGFLSADVEAEKLNIYGVASLAALAGMFSKQATDKLSEVFTTMFRTRPANGDAKRQDGLNNPKPVLVAAVPSALTVGTTSRSVRLTGSDLSNGTVVRVNGAERPTTFESSGAVTVMLDPADVAQPGTLTLQAHVPAPGGGVSGSIQLVVTGAVADGDSQGATPAAEAHDDADGCGGDIEAVTPDEALPPATGGVEKS